MSLIDRFNILLELYLQSAISDLQLDEFFGLVQTSEFDHAIAASLKNDILEKIDSSNVFMSPKAAKEIMMKILNTCEHAGLSKNVSPEFLFQTTRIQKTRN